MIKAKENGPIPFSMIFVSNMDSKLRLNDHIPDIETL